jgi:hypothetical protein
MSALGLLGGLGPKGKRARILALILALGVFLVLSCGEHASRIEPVPAREIGPGPWPTTGIKLLYDGDLGPDPCDYTTLSMLYEYHRRGMIELIGMIGVTPDPYQAATFSLYNQIYGSQIPFAVYRRGSDDVSYSRPVRLMYRVALLATTYANPNRVLSEKYAIARPPGAEDVPGPVEVYRRLLSEAEDDSITIFAAGPLLNFPSLLDSAADRFSQLDGRTLLRKKAKEFFFMGGSFPTSSDSLLLSRTSGAEYNWWALRQAGVTQQTIEALVELGKPVTYVGFEVGERLPVGREIVRRLGRDHPTSDAYYQYRATYDAESGEISGDNPAFDDVALYHLVEGGIGSYFGTVSGSVRIDERGANRWVENEGRERYLTLLPGAESELIEILTDRITGDF